MSLKLRTLKDPPPPEIEWLVEGVLPACDLITLAGEPASGKSALAATLAVAIASGGEWLGERLKPGGVLWLAAEAAASTERRIRSMVAGATDAPIVFASGDIYLVDPEAADDIVEAAREARRRIGGRDLRLIVVDALGSATRGADENSGRDMGPAMGALLKVVAEVGAAVLLLAHVGKGGGDGSIRGHSGLLADAGAHLVIKNSGSTRTLKVVKLRDGEAGKEIDFSLVVDGDGMRVEVGDERGAVAPAPRLSKGALLALEILDEAGGTLDHDMWRTKFISRYKSRSSKSGAKREAFRTAKKDTLERGLIRIDGNSVSVSEASESVRTPETDAYWDHSVRASENVRNVRMTETADGVGVRKSVREGGVYKTPADVSDTPQPETEYDEFGDPIPPPDDLRPPQATARSQAGRASRAPAHEEDLTQ